MNTPITAARIAALLRRHGHAFGKIVGTQTYCLDTLAKITHTPDGFVVQQYGRCPTAPMRTMAALEAWFLGAIQSPT